MVGSFEMELRRGSLLLDVPSACLRDAYGIPPVDRRTLFPSIGIPTAQSPAAVCTEHIALQNLPWLYQGVKAVLYSKTFLSTSCYIPASNSNFELRFWNDMEQNTLKRRAIGLTGVDKTKSFGGYVLFCPLTSSTARLIDRCLLLVPRYLQHTVLSATLPTS